MVLKCWNCLNDIDDIIHGGEYYVVRDVKKFDRYAICSRCVNAVLGGGGVRGTEIDKKYVKRVPGIENPREHLRECEIIQCETCRLIMRSDPIDYLRMRNGWAEEKFEEITGKKVSPKSRYRYSDEELLEALRKNPDLSMGKWMKRGLKPSFYTIINRFGSWNEGRRRAGLPNISRRRRRRYSDKEILEALRKNPDLNSCLWYERRMKPSISTISRHFGSWKKAREIALGSALQNLSAERGDK